MEIVVKNGGSRPRIPVRRYQRGRWLIYFGDPRYQRASRRGREGEETRIHAGPMRTRLTYTRWLLVSTENVSVGNGDSRLKYR